VFATTENDSIKVEALLALSRIFLRRNLQQSIEYGLQAAELAEKIHSLPQQSFALTTLGAAYFYSGKYDQALDSWKACVEIIKIVRAE
jgi:tetratricopeptide (TPR) repeat protein